MKAPYLIINGQPAEIGQVYWTVSMIDFALSEHVAGKENNILTHCYFDKQSEAELYQQMARLLRFLTPQVRAIEKKHQADGFLNHL